jgi:hypothetical protein
MIHTISKITKILGDGKRTKTHSYRLCRACKTLGMLTNGDKVATPKGFVAVENLQVGNEVLTIN